VKASGNGWGRLNERDAFTTNHNRRHNQRKTHDDGSDRLRFPMAIRMIFVKRLDS
jgi:hypothetical protein